MNSVIILSSGMGTRMKAKKNKTLISLGRTPIIAHTVRCFHDHDMIDQIILVVREEEMHVFAQIVEKYNLHKICSIVIGGSERQYSAYNALQWLEKNHHSKDDIVMFHNGANPFVSYAEVVQVIVEARKHGASAVAHPTKDTIKKVDKNGHVIETLDRSQLWNMQTPQAIRFDLAVKAFDHAHKNNYLGTDDVSLVEYLGKKVKIVHASDHNFKITTPHDLAIAKLVLRYNS